jgi:hypothetical protein
MAVEQLVEGAERATARAEQPGALVEHANGIKKAGTARFEHEEHGRAAEAGQRGERRQEPSQP